jgi:protein-tyrosine-phosphatase
VSDSFRILVVCTGNICRSPAAEYLLREGLDGDGVIIASAGTRAMTGRGVAAPMLELLAQRGIDASGHIGRQLNRRMLEEADLVLTATRPHRAEAAALYPAGVKRMFTLAQFGAIAREADVAAGPERAEALRELTNRAAGVSHRAGHALRNSGERDIVDPYGRSLAVYRTSLGQLDAAIEPLTTWTQAPRRL